MFSIVIRQHIAAVLTQPNHTQRLRQRLNQFLEAQGGTALPDEMHQGMIQWIENYITAVPELIDLCANTAQNVGMSALVNPFLQTATHYFIEAHDFIPDHEGLYGLLDDAYMANSFLMEISVLYQKWLGVPLLPVDLSPANQMVRAIIGESTAAQLDQFLKVGAASAGVQQLMQWGQSVNAPRSRTGGVGSWGRTWEDEMARLGAETGISFNLDYTGGW